MNHKNNIQKNKSKAYNYRFTVGRFFQVVVALVFLLFVARFLYLALSGTVGGVDLAKRANQKYRQNVVLKASRGSIFDRNGQTIAEDSHVYSIYAVLDKSYIDSDENPMYVVDKKKTAASLAQYIPLSEAEILSYLSPKKDAYQVEFGNAGQNLSLQTKKKIEKLKLPGIYFSETASRLYPNGLFASNVVGIAQKSDDDTNNLVGSMGIEKYFNKTLAGTDGLKEAKVDSYGYELPADQKIIKNSKDGNDVYMTLDTRLQTYLEDLMTSTQSKYQPKKMTAVLMEAKTGKVLAASQRPSFNPTTKDGLEEAWRDYLVEDVYEPGSVFKILTLGAAANSGNYDPSAYYNSGAVTVGGSTIRDWNYSGWGSIPFSQAFPRSSNVGMVYLSEKMGKTTWEKYIDAFHVGKKTNVTLPGEQAGSYNLSTTLDRAVTSFGQGVNVNVFQMMQIFSSLANGGQMVKPQLVSKITDASGKTVKKYSRTTVGKQVLSKTTVKTVIQSMRDTVNQTYGTGQAYKIDGQDIAVKTGTAQIAGPNGGYLTGDNNYIFSVAGIAPASNPKYILYITIQQPQKMTAAAETILSGIFKPLMKRVLDSDSGSSSTSTAPQKVTIPSLVNQKSTQAAAALDKLGISAIILGDGVNVLSQGTTANTQIDAGGKVLLYLGGNVKMPDMTGWLAADVQAFTKLTGIKVTLSGSGHVYQQSVKTDTAINQGSVISVKLKE